MDIVDQAADVVQACTEEAERRIRKQVAPESHPDFDGEHCVECDVSIPAGRLALGKVRCVVCQSDLELRSRTRIGWIPVEEV